MFHLRKNKLMNIFTINFLNNNIIDGNEFIQKRSTFLHYQKFVFAVLSRTTITNFFYKKKSSNYYGINNLNNKKSFILNQIQN